jgi:hypothetical protein
MRLWFCLIQEVSNLLIVEECLPGIESNCCSSSCWSYGKFQYLINHQHNIVTVILMWKSIAALHLVKLCGMVHNLIVYWHILTAVFHKQLVIKKLAHHSEFLLEENSGSINLNFRNMMLKCVIRRKKIVILAVLINEKLRCRMNALNFECNALYIFFHLKCKLNALNPFIPFVS